MSLLPLPKHQPCVFARLFRCAVLVSSFLVIEAFSQSNSVREKSGDDAWNEILSLCATPSLSSSSPTEILQQAKSGPFHDLAWHKSLLEKTSAFRKAHPAHSKVSEAANIEARTCLFLAGRGAARVEDAKALVDLVCSNTKLAAKDRYVLESAYERVQLAAAKKTFNDEEELTIIDKLYSRYGELDELKGRYKHLIVNAESSLSNRALKKFEGMKSNGKDEAWLIAARDRQRLIGKKSQWVIATYPAGRLDAGELNGKSTLLYFTTVAGLQQTPAPWDTPEARVRKNLRWVAVFTDGVPEEDVSVDLFHKGIVMVNEKALGRGGISSSHPPGALPYIFYLDAKGQVMDCGGLSLLARIFGRPEAGH
jgi:hypothetical protein